VRRSAASALRRVLRILLGLVVCASGLLLGLYGLFAILYRGDSGGNGDTYVELAGREIDATLAGAIALLLAVLLLLAAVRLLRRRRA
jgi:hypothetical protein